VELSREFTVTTVIVDKARNLCKHNYNDRYMKPRISPSSERPSRRQFDREKALDTAMELFWRHGYEATSMAMLLKSMYLTAPSLYAAFGNKEQLFREAVDRYTRTYGARAIAPLNAKISARDAIEQVLLMAAGSASSKRPPGCLISFGSVNTADPGSSTASLLETLRANMGRQIKERLRRAVEEKEIPSSTDSERLGRFYFTVFGGIMLRSLDGYSRRELEAVARDAMQAWPQTAAGN
jgi:AcrR family transcriptional regulator